MTEKNLSTRLNEVLGRNTTLHNLSAAQLVEAAICNGEGKLSSQGAFSTATGKYTGRSPNDKFIVKDKVTRDTVAWARLTYRLTKMAFGKCMLW